MFFFKSYLFVLLLAAFTNAAAIAVRKQDDATTTLQMSKLKDFGLLDKFDTNNLMNQLKGMNANTALSKVVASDSFKKLKTAADKKAGRKTNAKQSNAQKAKDTGLLDKLNEWGKGKSNQSKLNKMDGKMLLVKIAQSQAFKDAYQKMKSDRKTAEDKVNSDIKKGKKPTIVKIVHKNKGKPTATVISIKGGPAITLAAKGTKTTFAGKGYTVSPTSVSISTANGKNGAAGLSSGSFLFHFLAVAGGALGGIMLVL